MIIWSGKENRAADILNQSQHCHFYSKTATNKTATSFFWRFLQTIYGLKVLKKGKKRQSIADII